MRAKTYLLDTSFLIDYGREIEEGTPGPAFATVAKMGAAKLYVTPVTCAELLEGSFDERETALTLSTYQQTTIGWQAAKRCALNQARATQRMGENDAWQAALAVVGGHILVGHDKAFDHRPWLNYLDHAKG
jgi:predicted nucleic acid-binding protein